MKTINFISNQNLDQISGGWSGINSNIYKELIKFYEINYVGPINPEFVFSEKVYSKLKRIVGFKGDFNFFSEKRLKLIAEEVEHQVVDSTYNFFFGQTAWLACNFPEPYGVYLDADFKTYLDIFSSPEQFHPDDIERIAKKEEKWLQSATDIFIGSQWAWDEMVKSYKLDESKKVIVHTGGNIALPIEDQFSGGINLVFISLNFEKKGGYICYEAFNKVKELYPEVILTIIGEKPPNQIIETDGVVYAGLLKKTVEEDKKSFINILSKAFLLIHPTKMDTMGAVLIEAGYYGCPSIAPDRFGIPELVINQETGYILKIPFNTDDVAEKIIYLIENSDFYSKMRQKVWDYTHNKLTWDYIGEVIAAKINNKKLK